MKTLDLFHDTAIVSHRVEGVSPLLSIERAGPVLAKKLDENVYLPVSVVSKTASLELGAKYCVVKGNDEWCGELVQREPLSIIMEDNRVATFSDPDFVIRFMENADSFSRNDYVVVDQPSRLQYPLRRCTWSGSHVLQVNSLSSNLETFAIVDMAEAMTAQVTLHDREYFSSGDRSRKMSMMAMSETEAVLSAGLRDYKMGKLNLFETTVLPLTSQEVVPKFSIVHNVNVNQTTQTMSFSTQKPVPSGPVSIHLGDNPLVSRYLQEGESVKVEGLPVKDVKCKTSIKRVALSGGLIRETITVKATGRPNESVSIRIVYDTPYNLEVIDSSCGKGESTKRMEWDLVINEESNSEVTLVCEINYQSRNSE